VMLSVNQPIRHACAVMYLSTSSLAAAPAAQASDVIRKRWILSRHAIGHYRSARNPTACRRITWRNNLAKGDAIDRLEKYGRPAESEIQQSLPFHREDHPRRQ
jgi:hypothetical protein